MGFFGSPGYSTDKGTMDRAKRSLVNQTGQGITPGSSGYGVDNKYGVNDETGRSFTTLPKYSDSMNNQYSDNAFSQMANKQMDALKRGMAGGNRSAVSSFGSRGLGLGGASGALAANRRAMSQGASDIQRQNLMDKLGYNTDMYKFDRGQSLAEELGLRGARAAENAGRRADTATQFGMDMGVNQNDYNQALQTYQGLGQHAARPSSGWGGGLVKGLATGAATMFGGPAAGAAMSNGLNSGGGGSSNGGSGTGWTPNQGGAYQSPAGFNPDFSNVFNVGYNPWGGY